MAVGQQRVVIVGAGIVGLSTAYAMLSQGVQQVTVLEQEAVDHHKSTSHGISRLLRFEYGHDTFYAGMVMQSLRRWQRLENISQRTLYTPTGVLVLGEEGDDFPLASYRVLRELGLPVEHLSGRQCNYRFPQFAARSSARITYNALGGILHASSCLKTLRDLVVDLGGTISESCRVRHISHDNYARPISISTSSGSELAAEHVVVAAGPWVHRLLADLSLPVRLTRQYLLYFAGLPLSSFGLNNFPAFMAHDLYGFPIHPSTSHGARSAWLKTASHTFGPSVDPENSQQIDCRAVGRIVQQVHELQPALAHARLAQVDACIYDVTPDEGFILDTLPHDPRIAFATGLSGHGFKFGLLLGELLSSIVCQTPAPVALERFRLGRFSHLFQTSSVA
jgi:monomeric sarcosine oxidase